MTNTQASPPKQTALYNLHKEFGAKLVPFAGYEMPVQFQGIVFEHNHTREKASLFDVSHMGQAMLKGRNAAQAFETLVPGDIESLVPGQMRYTFLTNEAGGIIDDLMVTSRGENLYLVVNASRKEADFEQISSRLEGRAVLEPMEDHALLALQGPAAVDVLSRLIPAARHIMFMNSELLTLDGVPVIVSRCGYTGEDGYEISLPNDAAEDLARLLLSFPEVEPAGLGARDSLRLEAGLCLYGNDIDETTSPIEAGLIWAVAKNRREKGGFPGDEIILGHIRDGAKRKLVGIKPQGKAPARADTIITDIDGKEIGKITSGGFGPTIAAPVAMGYVLIDHAKPDSAVKLMVRGKALPATVIKLPFVPHRYHKD